MGFLCAKWLEAVWLIKSAERHDHAPGARVRRPAITA